MEYEVKQRKIGSNIDPEKLRKELYEIQVSDFKINEMADAAEAFEVILQILHAHKV